MRTPKSLSRRDALRGMSALALYTSPFGAAACGADARTSAAGTGGAAGAGAGAGGMGGSPLGAGGATAVTAGGATPSGGASPAGGATPLGGSSGVTGGAPAGGSSGGSVGGAASGGTSVGTGGTGGVIVVPDGGSSIITPPMFDNVASCVLTTTDIEGPFFIDDNEVPNDESLIRSDVREGLPGCAFRLSFRLLDMKSKCDPIAGAEMYIWACNADGYYSGFANQDPSKPYTGAADRTPENLDRFCRGVQISDTTGIVSFTTLYPGWYAGRPLHLHLVARMKGVTTRMITTQLYFPADFTTDVHETEPAYMARASMIPAGSRNPPPGKPAMPTLKHTPGLVVGTLNVIVNHS